MELWIRSQDKTTLILAQHLDIYDCTLEDDEKQHWWIEESGVDLGEYPSKERALEVLDEIQSRFNFRYENKKYEELDLLLKSRMITPIIYEMPKE